MKFNEMTYTRPDIGALLARCKELAAKAAAAPDGDALVRLYYEQSEAFAEYNTAANLANIHYTCDTRDAYWKAEQDFFDANGPAVTNASVEISRAFLANPHVDALTEKFGTTCVAGMKNAVLGMDDPKSVIMGAVDGSTTAMESIKNGGSIVCTGMNDTHAFGVLSTRILVAYLYDGTLPESNNIIQQPVICTIDNVDEYYSG